MVWASRDDMECIVPRRNRSLFMGQRPANLKPPAYLSANPPVPEPDEQDRAPRTPEGGDPLGRDPVRYGDWELKGIAVDF